MTTQTQLKDVAEAALTAPSIASPTTVGPAEVIDRTKEVVLPIEKKSGFISTKKIVLSIIFAVFIAAAYFFYRHLMMYQETDDAYLTAHVIPLSSRIEDNVDQVLIDDNEHVKRGQTIVMLDPRDYQRKVDEAYATVERLKKEAVVTRGNTSLAAMNSQATKLNAEGDMSGASSTVDKAETAIRECRYAIEEQEQILLQKNAELARAIADFERYDKLETQGAVTTSQRDSARRDLDVAKAACDATRKAVDQKNAQLEEAKHQLSIAQAQRVHSQGTERVARSSVIQEKVSHLQQDVSAASIRG